MSKTLTESQQEVKDWIDALDKDHEMKKIKTWCEEQHVPFIITPNNIYAESYIQKVFGKIPSIMGIECLEKTRHFGTPDKVRKFLLEQTFEHTWKIVKTQYRFALKCLNKPIVIKRKDNNIDQDEMICVGFTEPTEEGILMPVKGQLYMQIMLSEFFEQKTNSSIENIKIQFKSVLANISVDIVAMRADDVNDTSSYSYFKLKDYIDRKQPYHILIQDTDYPKLWYIDPSYSTRIHEEIALL